MSFFTRFIEHPVQAIVVGLVILLLGVQAISRLTVREYPETTNSTITIVTPYIGANAELVRGFVTTPLEQAIATAEGIDYLQSSSTQGASTINARLVLDYDPNEAVAEILTKIQQVQNQLPDAAEESGVTISTGQDRASMYLAFASEVISTSRISDYLNRAVRPRLETVNGVQQAQVFGAQSIAMRAWLDPSRMAALKITPNDVRRAIASSNFLASVGTTKGSTLSISLQADTNLDSVEGFQRLVLREDGDSIIRLEDVAEVTLGAESYNTSVFFEDKPVVFMSIETAPEANVLETVAGVRQLIPDIQRKLPQGLEGLVVYDSTQAINDSVQEVIWSLVQALVIVTVVIYLFLGAFRLAAVPGIAMPLAIVGAFFAMQMMGFTINLLTLLALILAIGTVVDDGIVMVENAARLIESGESPKSAAYKTLKELAGSVVAMNIVVLAVFAPVGLMGGLTGNLFTEFAYTVVAATLLSGVIALLIAPMLCAMLLKQDTSRGWFTRKVDQGFGVVARKYAQALTVALNARWVILVAGMIVLGSVFFFYSAAQRELAPQEDIGFLVVSAQADANASIDQLERWTSLLTEEIRQSDAVEQAFVVNGGRPQQGGAGNSAFGGVILKDWQDREQPQYMLQGELQQKATSIAGLQAVVISPPSLPGAGEGTPLQFVISSVEDPRNVREAAQSVLKAARESGLFIYIESNLKFDRLQSQLSIDRDRAAALGIDIESVGGDLATMLSGAYVNYFSLDGRSYRVVPQVQRQSRLRPEQILDYRVRARNGELVPLSSFVTLEENVQPRELLRFNQLNSATLSGVPAPGVSLGDAVDFLREHADRELSGKYVTDWAGRSRQYVQENTSLLIAFLLAILLMYLTLAAQYESFRLPAIMLVCVPMSLAGALLFFALGLVSINIYTQIGLLALIGSIIRHGILLVEFSVQIQREEGLTRREAMERAAELRFRSIVMTTVATFAGLVPLLISSGGPGAASRFAISFTLGIGMVLGTVFTLFVVPVMYDLVAAERVEPNH